MGCTCNRWIFGNSLRSLAGSLSATALDGDPVTLALETLRSNQALDLGGLGVVLLALAGDGAADDELADVVLLVETEEAADLGGTLGTESLGNDGVGEAGEVALTLLDDAQSEDSEILTSDGCTENSTSAPIAAHLDSGNQSNIPPRILLRLRSPVRRGR